MFARQSQRGAEAIVPSFAFRNTGKQEPNGSVCVCEVVRVKLCVCVTNNSCQRDCSF